MEKVTVQVLDDITEEEGASTAEFGLDGVSYAIDLTEANRAQLKNVLAPYVAAGRRTNSGKARTVAIRGTAAAKPDREQLRAIRDWARRNGLAVSDRGRISDLLRLAYDQNRPDLAPAATDAQPVAVG